MLKTRTSVPRTRIRTARRGCGCCVMGYRASGTHGLSSYDSTGTHFGANVCPTSQNARARVYRTMVKWHMKRQEGAKWADKPGSVDGRPFIYSWRHHQALARYPSAVRATPWRSYMRLLRRGLAKPPCCHDAGGLLHHRFSFSLTRRGGQRESSFLRRFPSGHPARPLTCLLPCGARTFLIPTRSNAGPHRSAVAWPTSRGRL